MAILPDQRVLEAAGAAPSQVKGVLGASAVARWAKPLAPSAWLVELDGRPVTLRHYQPYQDEADVRWEHGFAERLAATGFPAPRPVQAFSGRSWTRVDDGLWGTMTYLPGRPLAWEPSPDISEAGELLAEYHAAAGRVRMDEERPTGTPLSRLPELARRERIRTGLGDPERARRFESLLDELTGELRSLGYERLEGRRPWSRYHGWSLETGRPGGAAGGMAGQGVDCPSRHRRA